MESTRDIKGRIKSVTNIQQITKAMKMVAAARLRKAEEKRTVPVLMQTRSKSSCAVPLRQRLAIQSPPGGAGNESHRIPHHLW